MIGNIMVAAVIPAAGSGRRMQENVNKVWLPIAGIPVLTRTLAVFQMCPLFDQIVLVVNQSELEVFKEYLATHQTDWKTPVALVTGGKERQDSVENGLKYLQSLPEMATGVDSVVVIHDAARVLVTVELLEASIQTALEYGAVGVGVPVKDTIKQVDSSGLITATPDRSSLWAIQTPQTFRFQLICSCYQKISGQNLSFSDDCGVAEYCGRQVKMILGSYENFKITTPEDLVLAEAVLRRREHENRTRI